ncbi:hypothetical protein [Streptomyces cavernicola]|uniref:DUF2171 domain-containing protein n=1 Tax=Streptomyces cavernicola TaxID=3043613 RepID=A0ABT6SCS3_9ACTN|nr:hypothetical protein [Streptomyces sp. B-S-A6]MDI3405744.1 hypothetical protein [Streptomyces sp. B-S-A6]
MITKADIGARVRDRDGRVGILTHLMSDYVDPEAPPRDRHPRQVAFLRPVRGGGREWLASPEEASRV